MTRRIFAICASALLLASCGDSKDAAESNDAEETGPQGEVLGGSITDSMLPIAMVQSQSPKRGDDDGEGGADASEEATDSTCADEEDNDGDGWANFDYVKMPDYRWGIFLADATPERKIGFGDHADEMAWQQIPGEYRNDLVGQRDYLA